MEKSQTKYLLPLGSKTRISYPKTFHKSILLQDIWQNNKYDISDLITFVLNFPNFGKITCKQSDVRNSYQRTVNFNIICEICKIKLFKIFIDTSDWHSKIASFSICNHCRVNYDEKKCIASFLFMENPLDLKTVNSVNFPTNHPISNKPPNSSYWEKIYMHVPCVSFIPLISSILFINC